MKRVNFLIIIALLSISLVNAQQPEKPNFNSSDMANRTVTDLSKQITIDKAVQDSLKVVFVNFFDEMKSAHESGSRPDIRAMESTRDAKVKALLSDEQYKIYLKFMEERKPKRNGSDGEGMRPPRE